METIKSRDNNHLKFTRRVRDGKEKEFIFLEGVRLVEEAFRSDPTITEGFISEQLAREERGREIVEFLQERRVPTAELPENLFRSVADTSQSQGIILIAEKPQFSDATIDAALANDGNIPIVLFLEEINNPSNLGAVIRTAEAAGAAGVIASENSADAFSPKALRAAMGSSLRIPIWENANSEKVLRWASEREMVVTGAAINVTQAHTGVDWKSRRLLVLGSEAHGMSESTRKRTQELIRIPMANEVESLNLAVSCGIILFEARRQVFG